MNLVFFLPYFSKYSGENSNKLFNVKTVYFCVYEWKKNELVLCPPYHQQNPIIVFYTSYFPVLLCSFTKFLFKKLIHFFFCFVKKKISRNCYLFFPASEFEEAVNSPSPRIVRATVSSSSTYIYMYIYFLTMALSTTWFDWDFQ